MFDASLVTSLITSLQAALADQKIWFVIAVALGSGVVRGFSGFGGALIFIPLCSTIFGPKVGIAIFYLVDLVSATPFGYAVMPKCKWREIAPMICGHLIALPLGTWLLINANPLGIRWGMEGVVFLMLILLVSGWRYQGQPTAPLSFGVGTVAGVMGAASGISGPPVLAYWLGQRTNAAMIRINIMAYYALSSSATDVIFYFRGLFTWDVVIYAILTWPAYMLGLRGGHKLFHRSTDKIFRVTAYVLIAISAIISLPLFDEFVRK